ncbi:hypothetical protein QYE76_066787 [Lolium multiflorum]|uniref:Integrase catalytic domain-containing protein n=1 Tax=Lolium multiflorum TaxID=4521 RepID=A0AAD8SBC0_LOLMU|nr:hypothetical protein QYE76_066787 [Lolium multiflorum]
MIVDHMEIDVPVFTVRETPTWVKPIKEFLINGTLPVDETESRRIQRRSKAYTIINGEMYKRSVTGVLQRCVEPEEGREMLVEVHQGECGHHASSRALVAKVFRHGFYWPTALEDAEDLVRRCNGCQRYAKQNHTPASGLKTIPITWTFAVWCLDMVGPFKTARGKMTHILVMVDKFTKWLEVKPIAKCDGHTAVKFLKDVILRYGYPHSIITDNGTNFAQGTSVKTQAMESKPMERELEMMKMELQRTGRNFRPPDRNFRPDSSCCQDAVQRPEKWSQPNFPRDQELRPSSWFRKSVKTPPDVRKEMGF